MRAFEHWLIKEPRAWFGLCPWFGIPISRVCKPKAKHTNKQTNPHTKDTKKHVFPLFSTHTHHPRNQKPQALKTRNTKIHKHQSTRCFLPFSRRRRWGGRGQTRWSWERRGLLFFFHVCSCFSFIYLFVPLSVGIHPERPAGAGDRMSNWTEAGSSFWCAAENPHQASWLEEGHKEHLS